MRNCGLTILTKTAVCQLIFVLAIFLSSCNQDSRVPNWEPVEISHAVADNKLSNLLWSRQNVFIDISASVGLATSSDKVFVAGSTNVNQASKLNALDIFTGEPIWKSDVRALFPIIADKNGVYVEGDGIGGNVTKYNPDTGEVLWSKDFWDSGGVLHLIIYDNDLHVYLSPDKHKVVRTSDGKRILSLFPKNPPFFDSRECGTAYQTPVYTDGTIYFRDNESFLEGKICAVDISTGKLRWKSEFGVISNVAVSKNAVFVLVESGELLALDPSTGQKMATLGVSFDNQPFVPYSTDTTSGSFFLAYNVENDILIVYLGDSRQLFAFSVAE
jgi:outer membrane protein assembly factor BamB